MSPSRRPSSAPSPSQNSPTESKKTAQSPQHTIGQWAPERGTQTEVETSRLGPPTSQAENDSRQVNGDKILPASEKAPHANETADSPAANNLIFESSKADPWKRKTLLTLDGGGVRGYSSLLILRELMNQIAALEQRDPQTTSSVSPLGKRIHPSRTNSRQAPESSQHGSGGALLDFLPCHYFDYVAGTSTGGLIAIMLGRLSMGVEECIEAYEQFADQVFGHPRHFHIRKPPWVPRDKYNYKLLEAVIKKIVKRRSSSGTPNTAFLQLNQEMCRTIVIACQRSSMGAVRAPYLMRSYHHPKSQKENILVRNPGHGANYPIWQVARATSAAPSYFESVHLEEDDEQYELIDGGFGANNPTEEAYESIRQLHNDNTKAVSVLVSIGTGKNLRRVKSSRGGYSKYLQYINIAVKWATDSEKTHETVSRMTNGNAAYFRLNVEHGIGKMKLDAWKGVKGCDTLELIRTRTAEYLLSPAVQQQIADSARHLVQIRQQRSGAEDLDRWERFCHGVEYECLYDDCGEGQRFNRQDFRRHLKDDHRIVDQDELDRNLESGKRFPLYDSTP